MKIGKNSTPDLPSILVSLAENRGYTKIFAKVPSAEADDFFNAGYLAEATVPGFYNGLDAALFLAYYTDMKRSIESDCEIYERTIMTAFERKNDLVAPLDSSGFNLRKCEESDTGEMARIYKKVFPSYPFPIHSEDYVLETMRGNVDYFCVETKNEIIALSSAEIDMESSNVEMTDFATLPEWRGNGFGVHLLGRMEKEIKKRGIKTAYTIARASSPGMNITFTRQGYGFCGRLKNNTNISGQIESMNIWFKKTG